MCCSPLSRTPLTQKTSLNHTTKTHTSHIHIYIYIHTYISQDGAFSENSDESDLEVSLSILFPCLFLCLILMFKGILLYTAGIFFHVEWCTRQLRCSSIVSYCITSITHDQNTYTYSQTCKHINIFILILV